jgi:hypothetical protein
MRFSPQPCILLKPFELVQYSVLNQFHGVVAISIFLGASERNFKFLTPLWFDFSEPTLIENDDPLGVLLYDRPTAARPISRHTHESEHISHHENLFGGMMQPDQLDSGTNCVEFKRYSIPYKKVKERVCHAVRAA